jgi:hypothetical protein
MTNIPDYINWTFYFSVILTLVFLLLAAPRIDKLAALCIAWLSLQMVISASGYYLEADVFPPALASLVLPPLLVVLVSVFAGFNIKSLKFFKAGWLTFLHLVRIPVEMVLFWLYKEGLVPQDMTFQGRNFDIFIGLSAPIIVYLGYVKSVLPAWVVIIWNLVGMGFLLNIMGIAIMSTPGPFHVINLEQPNLAVLNFPFAWLPSFIVPTVFFAHLASIRKVFIR